MNCGFKFRGSVLGFSGVSAWRLRGFSLLSSRRSAFDVIESAASSVLLLR